MLFLYISLKNNSLKIYFPVYPLLWFSFSQISKTKLKKTHHSKNPIKTLTRFVNQLIMFNILKDFTMTTNEIANT